MTGAEDEALQVDVYLEALLARRAAPMSLAVERDRETIDLLHEGLIRFHPSFRFEEALASRLRSVAARRAPVTEASLVTFPVTVAGHREIETGVEPRGRRLLVGGAIASTVSIAGAALVAWRRGRPA